jgi:hypothetical protein
MTKPQWIFGRFLGIFLALPTVALASSLVFESPSGPLTAREIAGFKSWAQTFHPDPDNVGDAWAFGHSGQALEALGLMYEATGDRALLDRMIAIAGIGLAERNDLAPAPVGHRPLWPGPSTPAWGNQAPGGDNASHAGPETGDAAGKIAYAAYLILKTPGLDGLAVPDGDPGQLGRTYGERARTFVHLLDATEDEFVLPWFVRKEDGDRFYYPKDRRYIRSLGGDRNNAGDAVPWNQQFMLDCGLQRLAQCHELLRDDPARVALYDTCVRASLSWFLESVTSHRDPRAHGIFYTWSYAADDAKHVEDSVHAGLDLEGVYRCYLSGRYAAVLHRSHLQSFANEVVDVMSLGGGHFAGIVDGNAKGGHAAPTDFPRPNVLVILEFRPDAFPAFAQFALAAKRTAGDPTAVSHLLWVKYRLSQNLATAP